MSRQRVLAVGSLLALVAVACGGRSANVEGDVPDAATPDAGNLQDSGARDVRVPTFDAAQPIGPACYRDQDCNGDPNVSSLWGSCFFGVCMCKKGYVVQPNGKCGPVPEPACTSQGGSCAQNPATCPDSALEGSVESARSCGDLVAAVCCFPMISCKSASREAAGSGWVPVAFICCKPNDGAGPPICVNGWQTCAPGDSPAEARFGCPGG